MAAASCWHESCTPCGASASCLDPEFGHLGKLAMPTPVSDTNLGLAELFPPGFCVSAPPLLLEEARLSFTSSFLSCLFASLLSASFPQEVFSPWISLPFSRSWVPSCSFLPVWSRIYYNINNVPCIQGPALPHASAGCKSSPSAPR